MTGHAARRYIFLSIGTAILTMGLKFWSYVLTDSVGLFSDAAESSVNLIAALVALWALTLAARPPDRDHTFGHSKAEYFSSALEGTLILVAALSIIVAAVSRLTHPQPLAQLELGLGISLIAAAVNGGVAFMLLRAGRRLRSITLRADAHHLLTDVWTSVGVVVGLILVRLTGWLVLDPILAIAVALHICWAAFRILHETASGFMDTALPTNQQDLIQQILGPYQTGGIKFHAIRTRVAGALSFVSLHVLVPGDWTVQRGHDLCEAIEMAIARAVPGAHVTTHLEPIEDPRSWEDENLERTFEQQ